VKSGHVRVYSYISNLDEWKKLGNDIDGENRADLFGGALSLSMDGKTIAVGATVNGGNGDSSGHVRVFDYDDNINVWIQKGQDIDGESVGDNSGISVSLSRKGNIVAIGAKRNDGSATNSGHARIYQYVTRTQMWHQIGYDIDGVAEGDFFGRSVSLSAEGDVIAVGSPDHDDVKGTSFGHVRVFKFLPSATEDVSVVGDLQCSTDQTPFRLEFTMDSFPGDISWGIFNEEGNQLILENFEDSKIKIHKGDSITRRECLTKNVLVTLLINDQYGDGVCCNWGNGSFSVHYDGSQISTGNDFSNLRTLCLPPSQDHAPFSLDLTLDHTPVHTWWILYDSSSKTELLRSLTNYQGYEPFSTIRQALCVPKNHCLTYLIGDNNVDDKGFNGLSEGGGYALSWEGQFIKPKTGDFEATDIVRFGDSCNIPDGKIIVQIVFYAGFMAPNVHWQLSSTENSQNSVLLQSGKYAVTFSGHYYETIVSADSCLTFRMHSGGDASYSIRYNETLTHHEHRGLKPLSIVRFGSCLQCLEGESLFQLLLNKKHETTRDADWFLTDENGTQLLNGGDYDDHLDIYYYEYCAPDICLNFFIYGQGDLLYELIWDGKLVNYDTPLSNKAVKFGKCNNCAIGESLFQLELNTGWQPSKLSWKVVSSNGAVLLKKDAGDYAEEYQFQHEYYELCRPSTDCLNVTIDDLCQEACLKYELLWDTKSVEEGSTSFEKKPFIRAGACL